MNKIELYKAIVDTHISSGQGTPRFVFEHGGVMDILEEFITEGLVVVNTQHFSHLPDDHFVVPTNCYNCWAEKHSMQALFFVRKFLNIEEDNFKVEGEALTDYLVWLEKNKDELNKILLLNNNYLEVTGISESEWTQIKKFDIDEIAYIQKRKEYNDTKKIHEIESMVSESVSLCTKLESLYTKMLRVNDDPVDVKKYTKEKASNDEELRVSKNILRKLSRLNNNDLICDFI